MPDPLDDAVDARIAAYRPDRTPPFAALQARKRSRDMRRSGAALAATALAVAGVAFVPSFLAGSGGPGGTTARGEGSATAAQPPATLSVDGLEFLRRDTVRFVLRPGVRDGDDLGVFVTVPETYVPDGDCAEHYEPVVASERDDQVVLATWRYTPEPTRPELSCDGVGRGDRTVRLQLDEPLGDRPLRIQGREGPSQVLLLTADGKPVTADLAPADPDSAEICLEGRCVTVTDGQLLKMAAEAVNGALRVRPGDECSDQGRTDNVDRTYLVRFVDVGRTGPEIEVPLGCSPIRVVGEKEEYALDSGGPDVVRIAYDQQISPENNCLGIGGPSGGPETKDYVGLTLEQAEQRAAATNNDVIRIAGRDGVCTGIVRDHVINRVNVYLENGVVTAAHSF
jgi:hypothetical protein